MSYDSEKIKMRLWLGVILTFMVVLGVWAVQLKMTFPEIKTIPAPSGFEQEFKDSKAEFSEILDDLQLAPTPIKQFEEDTEAVQNAVLQNLKEKISEKNVAADPESADGVETTNDQ